jgi:hypothetical protein
VLPRNNRVNGSVGVVPVQSVAADVAVVSAAEVVAAAVSSSLIASVGSSPLSPSSPDRLPLALAEDEDVRGVSARRDRERRRGERRDGRRRGGSDGC